MGGDSFLVDAPAVVVVARVVSGAPQTALAAAAVRLERPAHAYCNPVHVTMRPAKW